MARRPREQVPGGIYHVFARGNVRGLIYLDERDRREYLELLGKTVRRTEWRLLAYCLMDNHVHLLIETPQPNLAAGMQWLHGHYARYFNDRHERVGHLFQGRYHAVLQRSDEQLWATVRYLALNPVDAGLVRRPEDYRWSSHRALVGSARPEFLNVGRLLSFFEGAGAGARERYLCLIADTVPGGDPPAIAA